MSLSILSQKSWSTGKQSSSLWQTKVFQNSNFCLKVQIFTTSNKYHQLFASYRSHWLTLFISMKMTVSYLIPNKQNEPFSLSSKNGVPWEKQLIQLTTQYMHKYFSFRQLSCFVNVAEVFIYVSHFMTWNIKKAGIQGSRFYQINILYSVIKNILKWKLQLLNYRHLGTNKTTTAGTVWCHCLYTYEGTSSQQFWQPLLLLYYGLSERCIKIS